MVWIANTFPYDRLYGRSRSLHFFPILCESWDPQTQKFGYHNFGSGRERLYTFGRYRHYTIRRGLYYFPGFGIIECYAVHLHYNENPQGATAPVADEPVEQDPLDDGQLEGGDEIPLQ